MSLVKTFFENRTVQYSDKVDCIGSISFDELPLAEQVAIDLEFSLSSKEKDNRFLLFLPKENDPEIFWQNFNSRNESYIEDLAEEIILGLKENRGVDDETGISFIELFDSKIKDRCEPDKNYLLYWVQVKIDPGICVVLLLDNKLIFVDILSTLNLKPEVQEMLLSVFKESIKANLSNIDGNKGGSYIGAFLLLTNDN